MSHMDRNSKGIGVSDLLKKTRYLPNHPKEDHIDHGRGSGDDTIEGGDVETDSAQRNQTDMSSLPTRLASFKNWPISYIISATSLAMSGFFYTQLADKVECYSCHGKIEQWVAGDEAVQEHRKHFPRCKLLNKNNKPDIEEVDSATSTRVNAHYLAMQKNRISEPSQIYKRQQHQSARIVDTNRPVHRLAPLTRTLFPRYCEVSAREETFSDWNTHQQPATLAEAGFFALGGPGESKCFYCGGGLRCWGPSDDPWVEHAKWFPKCEWLIRKKGENFIARIQREFPNSRVPNQTNSNQGNAPPNRNKQKQAIGLQKRTTTFDEAMQSKLVKQILEMGFDVQTVGEVVKSKLKSPAGNVFGSAAELFDAVMKASGESANNKVDPPINNTNKKHVNAAYGVVNREQIASSGSSSDDELLLPDEVKTTLRNLRDKTNCKICMDDDACVVFIPCGHLVTCMSCCNSLSVCPICRTEIKSNMKAYLA